MDKEIIKKNISKIFNTLTDNYVFIYTPPKVGSTTLVTSLRISLGKSYNIIHIHDEVMLNVLTGVSEITINDVIQFLSNEGKNVYVIDVYRTPIERKISEYFEKISPYHFNNTEENLVNYSIKRVINRFNKIFPFIENGDHYFEKYNIKEPIPFDFINRYTIQIIDNVKYIKLRLCDSHLWQNILSIIFKTEVVIVKDYQTSTKKIGALYTKFKNEYKIPENFIDLIKNCKYFQFYYNEIERKNYIDYWSTKLDDLFIPYTYDEYNLYMNICFENQYLDNIQSEHYIDNGCFCVDCSIQRRNIYFKVKNGENITTKIIHIHKEKNINKNIKPIINKNNSKINSKYTSKQFKMLI